MSDSPALILLLALAAIALLATLRLFVVRPRERRPAGRASGLVDARAALHELLSDAESAAGRDAERRSAWTEALEAYGRALDALYREDPRDPAVALKRRLLESKREELGRLLGTPALEQDPERAAGELDRPPGGSEPENRPVPNPRRMTRAQEEESSEPG